MNRFYKIMLKNIPYIILWYPRLWAMSRHPERYDEETRYRFAMKILDKVAKSGDIEVEVHGLEHIPKEGGCLVCPNHQDKFDALAVFLTFPDKVGVVAEGDLCDKPITRNVLNLVDTQKLIHRDMKSMYEVTERITERLRDGARYILFPEGRYEEDYHRLLPFMNGCFRSPLRSGTPIVPVAIIDSFRAFALNCPPPIKIQVHYLEPFMPKEFENLKTKDIAEMVRSRIQSAIDCYQR